THIPHPFPASVPRPAWLPSPRPHPLRPAGTPPHHSETGTAPASIQTAPPARRANPCDTAPSACAPSGSCPLRNQKGREPPAMLRPRSFRRPPHPSLRETAGPQSPRTYPLLPGARPLRALLSNLPGGTILRLHGCRRRHSPIRTHNSQLSLLCCLPIPFRAAASFAPNVPVPPPHTPRKAGFCLMITVPCPPRRSRMYANGNRNSFPPSSAEVSLCLMRLRPGACNLLSRRLLLSRRPANTRAGLRAPCLRTLERRLPPRRPRPHRARPRPLWRPLLHLVRARFRPRRRRQMDPRLLVQLRRSDHPR